MTSVKAKFRDSAKEGKEGTIYYQVIHERVIRQIRTSYKVFNSEWDEGTSQVVIPLAGEPRSRYISTIKERIKLDLSRLSQIISSLDRRGRDYTSNMVLTAFERELRGETLFDFMQSTTARLVELRKYRTAETYKTTLNSFMKFRGGEDLLLVDITSDMTMDYEAYLKLNELTMNSISFYMRILRAVYNRAVEKELVEQRFPFKKVYTGVDKTVKWALSLKDIKRIKELDLSMHRGLEFARDMFMLSFYTRGMSFVDMAYLRGRDLRHKVLSYRRRKTGQQLQIKWEGCMQDILSKYPVYGNDYLLPIITDKGRDDRAQYRNMLAVVNNKLKKVGEMASITTPLTMYVARHSWASVAKGRNIPISVISEGMGHDSETTTQIYLASLDTSIVDKANRLILRLL